MSAPASSDKVVGVLLTDDAWADLGAALEPYALTGRIGKFIYCREVHPDAPYFVMVGATRIDGGDAFEAEIAIPHRYVKLYISAAEQSQIGFV